MIRDPARILSVLERSSFRAKFVLTAKEQAYIHQKGFAVVERHAYDFINTRIAPAAPQNDGRQTPMKGHPVFIAQHATATCCRSCIGKWHRIEKGRALTEDEVDYVVSIIMMWIEKQGIGDSSSLTRRNLPPGLPCRASG